MGEYSNEGAGDEGEGIIGWVGCGILTQYRRDAELRFWYGERGQVANIATAACESHEYVCILQL